MTDQIRLDITCISIPFEIVGTVGDRPVWYRARGGRWELYETTQEALEHAHVGIADRIAGEGIRFLASGSTNETQVDSAGFAIARIMEHTLDWIGHY